MEDDFELRPATADDRSFLFDMLVEAVNWEPGRNTSTAEVRSSAQLFHYVDEWPGTSDLGVVATENERPVGAAWLTLLTSTDPGYGYVADDVPELSMAVVADRRRRGVGRRLLQEIAARAAAAELHTLSLSVERANPAAELYRSEGWITVEGGADADADADADTMIKRLDGAR